MSYSNQISKKNVNLKEQNFSIPFDKRIEGLSIAIEQY